MAGERRSTTGMPGRRFLRGARTLAKFVAVALGVYLILRAAVEPFVIDLTDPASHKPGWGGPTLIGVLAVHMLPGLMSLTLLIAFHRTRRTMQLHDH